MVAWRAMTTIAHSFTSVGNTQESAANRGESDRCGCVDRRSSVLRAEAAVQPDHIDVGCRGMLL